LSTAQAGLVLQHIDAIEMDTAAIGVLQCRNGAHQRRLARAIRPQQAEHSVRNVQADIVDGLDAIGIGFVQLFDL
jgi:hypothetical protein